MTMPHLMNCPHSEDSWCLSCVKEMGEENIELTRQLIESRAENERLKALCDLSSQLLLTDQLADRDARLVRLREALMCPVGCYSETEVEAIEQGETAT